MMNAKPRFGPVFDIMRTTRTRFKNSIRYGRSVETRTRAYALAKKLLMKDDNMFWKDMKNMTSSGSNVLTNTVVEAMGESDIADMWQKHYTDLLNANKVTGEKKVCWIQYSKRCDIKFYINDVCEAIKRLEQNKSPGMDGLQTEHYKYADPVIQCFLAIVLNCMVIHGYLQESAMDAVIIPFLKEQTRTTIDRSCYFSVFQNC